MNILSFLYYDKSYELEKAVKASIQILQTHERYAQFAKERNKLMKDDVRLLTYDWYENLVPGAEKALREYANLLQDNNGAAFITFIRQWWYKLNLVGYMRYDINESTDFYWRRLFLQQETKQFAYICLRIASIGITEADVERLFSIHKSMFNRSVTNLGTETLHHRCILHLTKANDLDNT